MNINENYYTENLSSGYIDKIEYVIQYVKCMRPNCNNQPHYFLQFDHLPHRKHNEWILCEEHFQKYLPFIKEIGLIHETQTL